MSSRVLGIVLCLLVVLAGCTVKSVVVLPSGEEYMVKCGRDSLVEFEKDGVKVKVDNRGRPSLIEKAITAPLLLSPRIDVGDGD